MKKINYKSDFDFIAKLTAMNANGESVEVGFPDYDFELIITSGCNGYSTRSFVASSISGMTKNCFNDNGQLHIVCDNHKLNVGELFGEFKAYLPNDIYPDGTQLNVEPQSLGIELVVGASDTPTTAEIELQLPYIYQSAYDLAVASGYEGSMEDYMRLSAELPEAVETAKLVKLSADSLANSASSLSESATKVSEGANTIKESATTLENSATSINASAESLSQSARALDLLSSEFVSGRKAIAQALTNRNYPTEPSESFQDMATKITDMSYGMGIFDKIGYTEDNNPLKEMVDYSYKLAKGWNPDGSTALMFRGNKQLVFAPMVDTSKCSSLALMFYSCTALSIVPQLDTSNVTSMDRMFYGCTALSIIPELDTRNVVNMQQITRDTDALIRIEGIYLNKVTAHMFAYNNSTIVFAKFYNLGMSSLVTHDFAQMANWGTGGEENRQSLIDSLITYSYDRASNGMATATIKLSANTKALLTEEEIAQITAKGFTIS